MAILESLFKDRWAARNSVSGKKPAELIYGVEDVPPLVTIVLSALQHVGLTTIFLIFPLAILREIGAPVSLATNVLSHAAIALGIGTLLQCLPKGAVGSGFLCPANYSAIYLAPSLAAAKLGCLPERSKLRCRPCCGGFVLCFRRSLAVSSSSLLAQP